jgi:hypothetical protein
MDTASIGICPARRSQSTKRQKGPSSSTVYTSNKTNLQLLDNGRVRDGLSACRPVGRGGGFRYPTHISAARAQSPPHQRRASTTTTAQAQSSHRRRATTIATSAPLYHNHHISVAQAQQPPHQRRATTITIATLVLHKHNHHISVAQPQCSHQSYYSRCRY